MSRPLLTVPILLLGLGSPSLACVNTSYSREEEGQITSNITTSGGEARIVAP
ncbi:MAG: hypothetical protein VCA73_19725 [Roseibacillus sp.]|jgi:hypothetical protein